MSDLTPLGQLQSFGGTPIPGMPGVASIGYPSIDKAPVEAYEPLLGQQMPVDLLNGTDAPQRQTVTIQVLLRAPDAVTDPGAAYAAVVAGYQALESLPQIGTLVINQSSAGGGISSCQARRKPITLKLTSKNALHLVVDVVFTPTSKWQ